MKVKSNLVEAHIFRKKNNKIEFLVMKRAENELYANIWQMVTGSTEKGEKAFETAIREITEETSLTPISIWIVPKVNSFYLSSDDSINMVPVFVAEVEAKSKVILSKEHSEFKWCNGKKAKKLFAWAGQREAVDIICECLTDEKSKLKLVKCEM